MTGMEEGIFPHSRSMNEDKELEEERRLCYVGMTRARERLFLTSALMRRLYNSSSYNLPSRFLDEVPATLVTRLGGSNGRGMGYASREPRTFGRAPVGGGDRWRRDYGPPAAARRAAPGSDEAAFVDHLQVGKRVRHPEWGVGTIRERIGEGEDLKVVVTFAGVGRKKLAAALVPLEPA
jgi:DNA helicase-2/ATP-dependent DNA helicase PcrA